MNLSIIRLVFLAISITGLSACKLRIELAGGGYVQSSSGLNDCREESDEEDLTDGLDIVIGYISQAHNESTACEIDVVDTNFDEYFTAIPEEGYEFSHWANTEGAFYGGSTENPVHLFTTAFGDNESLLGFLSSDQVFHLEPVFQRINTAGNTGECSQYEGSFERIQSIIFESEAYGCSNSACHGGGAAAGGLDLSTDVAYQNLIRVNASANLTEPMQLVYPGDQHLSFLFQKLDAGTNGTPLPQGGGLPMPLTGKALSADHLEAMRLWIRNGAPETTDVDDVASLLGCDSPTPAQANKIARPDAPPAGEGVQLISGPWTVEADSEDEVCFATYYDLEQNPESVPAWAKADCDGSVFSDYSGSCVAINGRTLTQDPQSHHSIINVYTGSSGPADNAWGPWQCSSGPSKGMTCDPTRINDPVANGGADCGGGGHVCATEAKSSVACRGVGPADRQFRTVGMGGAQSPISEQRFGEGVFSLLPTKGVITWNSHAFNLSAEDTTIDQYNNFLFAPQNQRQYFSRGIFDTKDIFIANVPPYERRTYCSTYTLPVGARLTQLGSHTHKRGVFWQTWLPPQDTSCTVRSGCVPNTTTADYVSKVYNDPLYLNYDIPLAFDSANATDRTLKFCATYDNGVEYPELLKLNSTSVGTTCDSNRFCANGSTPGQSCNNNSDCGDGGMCDACTVRGGVTTEDEMFLLLGNFYVVPESERE